MFDSNGAFGPPAPINILTTNWHVPYLHLLCKIPNTIWWVLSFRRGMAGREWNESYRLLPANARHLVLDHPDLLKLIKWETFELIVMQAINDLPLFKDLPHPKILVFHNALQTEFRNFPPDQLQGKQQQFMALVQATGIHPVYISGWKASSYGVPGSVILPGVDELDFPFAYNGRIPALLRSCSNFAMRDFMNGKTLSDAIVHGMTNTLLGENNGEECTATNVGPDGKSHTHVGMSRDHEHLKAAYREHRAFVLTNMPAYEDGWNLGLLEAMATGMPILSSYHPRSPIVDGVNGFMADDPNVLRGRAMELLRDREQAQELGARARDLVLKRFPISTFLSGWSAVLAAALPTIAPTSVS